MSPPSSPKIFYLSFGEINFLHIVTQEERRYTLKRGGVGYVLCTGRMVVVRRAHECIEALASRFFLSYSELINTTQSAMQERGEFTRNAA